MTALPFGPLTAAGLEATDRDDYIPSRAVDTAPAWVQRPVSGTQIGNGPDELLDVPNDGPVDIAAESQALNNLLP